MRAGRAGIAPAAAILACFAAGTAHAAIGAYAVDAAEIAEVGSCKIESWLSSASNTDFSAVVNPSCVVNPFTPVELSMPTSHSRGDGEGSAVIQPKAKMNIAPTGTGKLGFSFYAGGSFDALAGDNLTAFAVVPATFWVNETMRVNVNGGWLWDRTVDRHYLLYGIGFDWTFTDTLRWTIEVFGQAGQSEAPSVVQPRFQTGVRYRPNEIFSVDLIYGRNISGENANWITLGTTIRFPVPGGRPDHL